MTTRSFKTFNAIAFREDLKAAPFESLTNCSTPDEMVEVWASMFSKIADAHAPIRTRRVRNRKSPWITTERRELITGRNRLKRQATLTKQPSIWDEYKKVRNRINNEIKTEKANYYKSKISQNTGDPKEIWRTINKLTYREYTSNSSVSELKSGNKSFTKPDEICETLNEHFTSVGPNLASTMATGSTSFDSYIKPAPTTFTLQHTTASQVLKLIAWQIISEQGHCSR